jgi:hypothetical protein
VTREQAATYKRLDRRTAGIVADEHVSLVAEVASGEATLLADLAKNRPGFARGAPVAAVLVRLTELAALVLPMRRVSHCGSDP